MNKSPRRAMAPSTNRRFSQPVMPGSSSSSSSSSTTSSMNLGRRGSDNTTGSRGQDVLPPPPPPPVSQYDDKLTVVEAKGPRKMRSKDGPEGHTFDADQFNPDGSLRTIHRMPDLSESFAQARNARYIRHRVQPDSEKEVPVEQIFRDA